VHPTDRERVRLRQVAGLIMTASMAQARGLEETDPGPPPTLVVRAGWSGQGERTVDGYRAPCNVEIPRSTEKPASSS
jgi:hypothetical protein